MPSPEHLADDLESFLSNAGGSAIDAEIQALEQAEVFEQFAPGNRYLTNLQQANIELGEARTVVDRLCVQLKPFRKEYEIMPGVVAVFQTRTPAMQREIDRALDRSGLQLGGALRNYQAYLHLVHSLCKFKDVGFLLKETGFPDVKKTAELLDTLPEPVFHLLWRRLSDFESLVALALGEGFAENF